TTLAPPTGQIWTFVITVTFEPFDRFLKMRYHWIPWIKTNSTFNCANFRLYRFSVIPSFIKKPLKAYSSYNFGQIFFKITRDDLQTKPHKRHSYNFDPHNRLSGTATQIQQKRNRSNILAKLSRSEEHTSE